MRNFFIALLVGLLLVGAIAYLYRENAILSTKLKDASFNTNLNGLSDTSVTTISDNLKTLNSQYLNNSYLIRLSSDEDNTIDVSTICKQNNGINCYSINTDGELEQVK